MAQFATYRHKSYDGGLKTSASRRDIERNQASVLENWDITYRGRLLSRKGLEQVGNTQASAINSGGVYTRKNGTRYLLINTGTKVKYLDGSTFSDVGTSATITTAERMSYANVIYEDKIYMSSENNGLLCWNAGAGGLSAIASSISGNVILWYQNHLFHLNAVNVSGTKYYNDIFWSDFGDPETYTAPTTNRIPLPGEGRAITANALGNKMVIFKENSYMFLAGYGATSWTIDADSSPIENVDSSIGCIAPKGTVRVGANELWFMDNQGYVRRITQTSFGYTSQVMSDNLDPNDLNLSNIDLTVAAFDNDKVYFAVPSSSSSTLDTVWVYDMKAASRSNDEAWTTYTGWEVADLLSFGESPVLHVIGSTSKKVYSHTGGDDDGTAVDCRWDGKNDDYDQPERYKKYAYGYIYSQAQGNETVSVYSSIDGASFSKLKDFDLNSEGTPLGPTGLAKMGPTGSFILGGNSDLEEKYYFADGGGSITGKTNIMSIRASVSSQVYVDTFTNHFVVRSLK